MDENNVRANEVDENEIDTEVMEASDSSNASALLMGFIGGCIAYAFIGGVKKLRVIAEERWAAKKLAESAKAKPVGTVPPEPVEAPQEPGDDATEE